MAKDKTLPTLKHKRGYSYLVALYNLHLPEGRLSPQKKKRLSHVVWRFFDPIPISPDELPQRWQGSERPLGFIQVGVPLENGSHGDFAIYSEMIGIVENHMERPGDLWWNSEDFLTFQRNYQHLRGCIGSFVDDENYGTFYLSDLEWLNKKAQNIFYMVCINHATAQFKTDEFQSVSQPIMQTLPKGFLPTVIPTLKQDLLPSDLILYRAYLELIDVINQHQVFRRCVAPDCDDIFIPRRKDQEYHTKKCLWRHHRQKKRSQHSPTSQPQEKPKKKLFIKQFPSDNAPEEKCYEFLKGLLHPKGLRCPDGHTLLKDQAPHTSDPHRYPVENFRCRKCGKVFNIFTNTIWSRSRYSCSTIVGIMKGVDLGIPTKRLAEELDIDRSHLSKRRVNIEVFLKQYAISP